MSETSKEAREQAERNQGMKDCDMAYYDAKGREQFREEIDHWKKLAGELLEVLKQQTDYEIVNHELIERTEKELSGR